MTHARHSKAIGIAAFWQSTPSRSFPAKLPNSFRIKAGFVSTRRRDLLCFGNISATFSRTIGAFCRDCPINIGSTKSTFEQVVETVELGFLFGPDFLESSFGIVLGPTNCSGAYGWILHGASASEISSRKVSDLLTLCGMAGNVLDPSSMVPLGHQKQLVSFPGDLE